MSIFNKHETTTPSVDALNVLPRQEGSRILKCHKADGQPPYE
jgi:hypothetical protein